MLYVPRCNIDLLSADSLSKQTGCKLMFDGEKGNVLLIKNLNNKYVEIIIGERCQDGLYRTYNIPIINNRPKRNVTSNVLFKDYVSAAIIKEDKSNEMIYLIQL